MPYSLHVCPRGFVELPGIVKPTINVKCETFNFAGSIKFKPAMEMVEALERSGRIEPGDALIESSSGNLGIALSTIAAAKGYRFTCVTDPNATQEAVRYMTSLGTSVIVVERKDSEGGYLATRLALINKLCSEDPRLVWVNQYANPNNWMAHYKTTAPEILCRFPAVTFLFVGTGTGGTLMGCARYFREHSPDTKIVAVDAEGSVTFGSSSGPRRIPGIGTSRRPEIIDESYISDILHVPERETVQMCRQIAKRGLLIGGSTGSVLAGIARYSDRLDRNDTVVTLMPDLGTKYLDTIYNDEWAKMHGYIDGPRPNQCIA